MALEFTETFKKGQMITSNDIPLILQCKNIDYGHVIWNIDYMYHRAFSHYNEFTMHLVNNIIDINSHPYHDRTKYCSYISGITQFGEMKVVEYIINNRCTSSDLLVAIKREHSLTCYKTSFISYQSYQHIWITYP